MLENKRRCIECRWCGVRAAMMGGAGYWCMNTAEPLPGNVLERLACSDFAPPPGLPIWAL